MADVNAQPLNRIGVAPMMGMGLATPGLPPIANENRIDPRNV